MVAKMKNSPERFDRALSTQKKLANLKTVLIKIIDSEDQKENESK